MEYTSNTHKTNKKSNRRTLYPLLRQLRRQNERAVLIKGKHLDNKRAVRPDDNIMRDAASVEPYPQTSSARTTGQPQTQNTCLYDCRGWESTPQRRLFRFSMLAG